MHFFEKQRVGLIGQTSVSLQKILIFFMICNLFTFFHGGFLQFFLCLIGFIGAYRKKTCLLSIYFWVNIALILFSLVSVVLVLGSTAPAGDQWTSSSSWASSSSAQPEPVYVNQQQRWNHHPLAATAHKIATWATDYSSESDQQEETSSSASTTASDSTSTYSSSETILIDDNTYSYSSASPPPPAVYESDSVPTFVFIVALVLTFVFAYLQAKALALAWRLRKLLLLPAIPILNEPAPTPSANAGEQVHYFPNQENNSCAEPQPEQIQQPVAPQPQAYPSYYPYPYPQSYGVPQGMMMVPHQPTYWGQPPVFYSYAPQPQQPQSNGEKQ